MDWNWKRILLLLSTVCCLIGRVHSRSYTFTVKVSARDIFCLYQPLRGGQFLEVDYQVIEGGDLDLDCHIRNPSARPIKTFTRQSEGYHTFVADDPGDYAVCLDNSYSSMVPKLVYLILETNAEDQLEELHLSQEAIKNYELEGQVESIENKLSNIGHSLNLIITQQRHFRGRETRHRKTAESNFDRVNYFSVAQIIVLIIVAAVQVGMVRVFFREKRGAKI